MRLESKGIECDSVLCGCSNPSNAKSAVGQSTAVGNFSMSSNSGNIGPTVTFDQFYEVMVNKIRETRPNPNILFESKDSNVSCFLWPMFAP